MQCLQCPSLWRYNKLHCCRPLLEELNADMQSWFLLFAIQDDAQH